MRDEQKVPGSLWGWGPKGARLVFASSFFNTPLMSFPHVVSGNLLKPISQPDHISSQVFIIAPVFTCQVKAEKETVHDNRLYSAKYGNGIIRKNRHGPAPLKIFL